MSRPLAVLDRFGEVEGQRLSGRNMGIHATLDHVRDPAKVEAGVVRRNPRVWNFQRSCQFDYGRHGGRHFAVVHLMPFAMLRPDVRLDRRLYMNHLTNVGCP